MSTGYYANYAGSIAPIEHFTRALAKELMDRGIAVTQSLPALDTSFFYPAETAESVQMVKQWTGGLGSVQDVVPLVEFRVSPGATWLTGKRSLATAVSLRDKNSDFSVLGKSLAYYLSCHAGLQRLGGTLVDNPRVIAWCLESKCRARRLLLFTARDTAD
jgi:hypothetical protein